MIRIEGLTYWYPAADLPVLKDVTLHVDDGEFVIVAGRSGSGKSTLLRALNGLVPHFTGGRLQGRLQVWGHDPVVEGPKALSSIVGFVFQDPESQFVVDRVQDELAFALENAAVPAREIVKRVGQVLELMELEHLADRPVDSLSGGEKQRVAIAAALALRPSVLVLDEPTSQLDPQSAHDVLDALVRLNQDLGLTVVLAEHRLERVLPHADRLVVLSEPGGEVVSGPPRATLDRIDLAPPVVRLGRSMGWTPLPLSLEESGRFTAGIRPASSRSRDGDCNTGRATPLLSVRDVSFAYDTDPVLKNVTLEVGGGELLALMGRNGSAKTTLLKCVVGLLRPGGGEILLENEVISARPTSEICRAIGYLPQEPDALLFADSVEEELRVTLRNHGLLSGQNGNPDRGRLPLEAPQLLKRLGLEGLASVYPRDLSVGQRQRVALGAVTVTRPRLLLLDEPTRGMDYFAKRELVRLLREWQVEGTGILLVTHDVELAAEAADRIAVLDEGRIVADGPPVEVFAASPLFAPQVARLFPGSGWLTVEDALTGLGVSEAA